MSKILVSIIIPIFNGSSWIDQCFQAILKQDLLREIQIEVCICNDASQDDTEELLNKWCNIFHDNNIQLKVFRNESGKPQGVGYSKNRAISISTGTFLCFQDVDDIMLPLRITEQYKKSITLPYDTIVGSRFKRIPENSTNRYTEWANSLPKEKLHLQIYTSHGPTIIMPTWFCHRTVYENVGGFSEDGKGTPEDLIFFYKHLDLGGKIFRVDDYLLLYTYHSDSSTFSVKEETIWNLRLKRLEIVVLDKWQKFTIWNAGKQGRKFYNSLSEENRNKVIAMCDVDVKKIGKEYVPFDSQGRNNGRPVNIVHFKDAKPPFVVCVKINLTNGEFEKNLSSLKLIENVDYVLFS